MGLLDIRVPQLGEGLQEALIVALLKAPGDHVEKDEPIFEIETDKARVVVEAALAGRLSEWLVTAGDVVTIGAAIGRIESVDTQRSEEPGAAGRPGAAPPPRARADRDMDARLSSGVRIPPRTRAHGRTLGLSEEELRCIPASSGKLLPQDVDRYLIQHGQTETGDSPTERERRLSPQQRMLTYRFRQSAERVIPATITGLLNSASFERALQAARAAHPDTPVGPLEILAYGVAQAARRHPNFRSVLVGDDTVREYPRLTLGIAVHRSGGDLVTAVIADADTLTLPELTRAAQTTIVSALEGLDQSNHRTQVILTYVGESSIIHAVPTLVSPAVATLFVGAPLEAVIPGFGRVATVSLTFDHRLINGIEAAQFLSGIAEEVERLGAAGRSARTDVIPGAEATSEAPHVRDTLRAASHEERIARLDALLRDRVADLLGVARDAPDYRRPLRSLGLTSILSVALCKGLERDLGIPVPVTLVWNHPTIAAIANHLATHLEGLRAPEASRSPVDPAETELERLLAEVEGLSDAEAHRLLTDGPGQGENP
jgi:pyruvate dehydrogenase E2 component (dihydrolipoamide acetyltransferase)